MSAKRLVHCKPGLGQPADGVLDGPSPTIEALQNYLNSHEVKA